MNKDEIRITPLGGLGEIGLNCQLWESGDQVVMIDCGLMFPEDRHQGVDVLIPHFDAVRNVRDKLQGIILTHGHEDHIGALPWILQELEKTRIFSSPFTLALVRHKLDEHNLLDRVQLIPVSEDEPLFLGEMKFNFFPVCHSIPYGFALGAETKAGKIIHSGDFKIDPDPLDGTGTNLRMFQEFAGEEGVRLLLSDSTNVMRPGYSVTERQVADSLDRIFREATGRIVITLFSSHLQRISEVFNLAAKYGKKVVISGKSLANNIDIAVNLGYLRLPPGFHNAYNGMPDVEPENTVLIVTGSQGEPLSALSRMVMGQHKQLSIEKGDTVIMSSRIIPGHTRPIMRLINEMYRLGAEVFYETSHPVHASGHAHAGELEDLLRTVRPEVFVPVHGEYQHLVIHGRLAEKNGVRPENIFCLEDGEPLVISRTTSYRDTPIQADCTLVDGKGVGDIGAAVLHERKMLGDEGMVAVFLALTPTGELLCDPEIRTLGFVYEPQSTDIMEKTRELVLEETVFEKNPQKLKENIISTLRRFFRRLLDRDPVIVPVVSMVDFDQAD